MKIINRWEWQLLFSVYFYTNWEQTNKLVYTVVILLLLAMVNKIHESRELLIGQIKWRQK
jgi:hypothetical protein